MNNQKLYSKESVLLNCCNDENFVKTVVDLFIEHMPKYLEEIEVGVKQENWYAVYRSAHTMKANIDLFNIVPLKSLIRDIEKQGKSSTPEPGMPSQLNTLKAILQACITELKQDYAISD